jgi:hypothetical protein
MVDDFTYDLDTNVGKLRLYVNDKDDTDFKHTDAELEVFLAGAANIYYAAADVLTNDADRLLKEGEVRGYKLGDRAEDKKNLAKDLLAAAEKWKEKGKKAEKEAVDFFDAEVVPMAPEVSDEGEDRSTYAEKPTEFYTDV